MAAVGEDGIETRGGEAPGAWKAVQAGEKPKPNGSVFDGGFVMAQPDDPPVPDILVIAGSDE